MPAPNYKPPWTSLDPTPDAPSTAASSPAPVLIEPEYASAFGAYRRAKSPENASALLTAVHPVLSEAVKSYAGGETGSATAMARAKSLALEAFDRYDPARAKLRTHLLSHLRGLRRQTARSAAGVYAPESWRIDRQRLDAALPEVRDALGREPSDAELADHLGVSLDRIQKARTVPGVLSGSQVQDHVSAPRHDEAAWQTWLKIVYHDLGPVDQAILERSFGMHGHPVLSGSQIAKKVGLSPGAVSQRRARIQKVLDEYDAFMGRTGKPGEMG
jgi:hypothetical protein